VREIVNQHSQLEGSGRELDVGLVVLVLVCNRLLAPQPLVHVERWLAQHALVDLLGWRRANATMIAWSGRWT